PGLHRGPASHRSLLHAVPRARIADPRLSDHPMDDPRSYLPARVHTRPADPMNAIHLHESPDLPAIPVSERLAHPRDLAPAGDRPDARIFLLDPAGIAIAHAALWWRETPPLEGEITGSIGGFDATDEMSAVSLLHAAIARLRTMA